MPKAVTTERSNTPMAASDMTVSYIAKNPLTAPNRTYLYLTHTGETGTGIGSNKFYQMESNGDGTFTATYGRIGGDGGGFMGSPRSCRWNMDMWDTKYYEKAHLHGYLLIKDSRGNAGSKPAKQREYATIRNRSVREVVDYLNRVARQAISRSYKVSADHVSPRQIAIAQDCIDGLKDTVAANNLAEFNTILMDLYAAIPRRIDYLAGSKARTNADMARILSDEMTVFSRMKAQVAQLHAEDKQDNNEDSKNQRRKSLLAANGLSWKPCTDEEMANIRKHLGKESNRIKQVWRVTEKQQEKRFNKFVKVHDIHHDGVKFLYHGSRNENFWSIITTGLQLNPKNVTINGKMFGNGIYFAPLATKSIGYTSVNGSYWARGHENKGYLAVYKVATGKPYDVYTYNSYEDMDYNELQRRSGGADCLWAHAGNMLRNDEVIIYREDQYTLRYIIEIG